MAEPSLCFCTCVTEVNLFLYLRNTVWTEKHHFLTLHQFRRKLAFALIYNRWIVNDQISEKKTRPRSTQHVLSSAPPHAKKFLHGKWVCTAKNKYQGYVCKQTGCKTQIRTYCSCSPGMWLCKSCFSDHICSVVTSDTSNH